MTLQMTIRDQAQQPVSGALVRASDCTTGKTFERFTEEQEERPFPRNGFPISSAAVKQQARVFRSVLKLDRNFHIYIHGNRELIQQGKDADGRKFYKIYYDTES